MNKITKAAGLGLSLIAILGVMTLTQPARAQSLREIGRDVVNDVVNRTEGRGYNNYDYNGDNGFNAGRMQRVNMLDHRADRLSARLREAAREGSINPRQFNWMNNQLQGALAQIRNMRQSGDASFQSSNYVDRQLSNIENRLNFATAGRPGGWY